jgi:hypothetical protein
MPHGDDESNLEALDAQPEEEWLVPPWHQIEPEDRLKPAQLGLLREVIERRAPRLLPQLDTLGVTVQRPSERERLRNVILTELIEAGRDPSGDNLNGYGRELNDLIWRLGRL